MADLLNRKFRKASDALKNYKPSVDRMSSSTSLIMRLGVKMDDLPTTSPSVLRLMDLGMKQDLVSKNVLNSATLAQLKLLQEEVVNFIARRQAEPVLRLRFDNVVKRIAVPAVGKNIPQASFQAALQLPGEHDEFVEIIGLRAQDGEELLFEEGDDEELMLFDWEEHIVENDPYTLLYIDKREEMVDELNDEERAQILTEFDAIDSDQKGTVSLDEINVYADRRLVQELIQRDSELEDLRSKGAAGIKAAKEQERLIRLRGDQYKNRLLDSDIDGDGTVELHEFFRVRAQQLLAKRGVLIPQRKKSTLSELIMVKSSASDELSDEEDNIVESEPFCPGCGKELLPASTFCTKCGRQREKDDLRASVKSNIGAGSKKKTGSRKKSPRP